MESKENKKDEIFFSIIIPTYNRASIIAKTLFSLLSQEYKNFEVIIVDDGSTDNTEQVIKNIDSVNVFYHKIKNSERGFARNYGAKLAKGDYINFFDSDDLALPNHLSTAMKAITECKDPEIFHLNYIMLNADSKTRDSNIGKHLLANKILINGNVLSCNGVFLKREVALKFPFNESRKLSVSEDWDLWLRLSARYKIYLVSTVTSYIVNHEARSVMTFNEQKLLDRTNELLASLKNDSTFVKAYPKALNVINAHMFSYMALHAVLDKQKSISFKYLKLAIKVRFSEIFTRRFLATIKHLIF